MDTEQDLLPPCSQRDFIIRLPIGESYSMTQRLDLTYGIGENARTKTGEMLRNRMDQAVFRARRLKAAKKFIIELTHSLSTRGNALFITCVVTRTN